MHNSHLTLWAFPIVAVVAVMLPVLDLTTIDILIVLAVSSALATSWNWAVGLGGLLNLAHIAYYGIGAYACALAVVYLGIHPVFGVLAGMAISGCLAWATCALSLKMKVADLYFALLTVALMEGLAALCRGLETQYAPDGITLPFRNDPASLMFLDKTYYYYMLIGLSILLVLIQYLVQRSKYGLLIYSSRDSQNAAASLGVPVNRVLMSVSVASALPASLVGSIITLSTLHVEAPSVFQFELLLAIIVATVIGGVGSLWGPFAGAAVVTVVQEVIRRLVGGVGAVGIPDIVFGVMLLVIVLFVPAGFAGLYRQLKGRER